MAQRQIPGGPFLNDAGNAQRQFPGGPFLNEAFGFPKLYPTSIISKSKLAGAYTDIDDSPASPDSNWLTFSP